MRGERGAWIGPGGSGSLTQADDALRWRADGTRMAPAAAGLTAKDTPSLFTALQEQHGLKLEPARGPVEGLVIDSVEQPTPD